MSRFSPQLTGAHVLVTGKKLSLYQTVHYR